MRMCEQPCHEKSQLAQTNVNPQSASSDNLTSHGKVRKQSSQREKRSVDVSIMRSMDPHKSTNGGGETLVLRS